MPIKVDTEVQKLGAQEEVVEELLGLHKLNWDFTTFKDNLRELNTSLKVSSTHIDNSLDLNTELTNEEENLEKTLKKEIQGLSDHPAYELYKSAKTKHKILARIIMHYNLQNKVLVDSINALEILLIKAHEYGAVRQKVENELEILKETRTTLKETVASCLNMMDAMQKNYFNSLGNYNKQIIDMTQKANGIKAEDTDQQLQLKLDNFKNDILSSLNTKISVIKEAIEPPERQRGRPKKEDKQDKPRPREYDDDNNAKDDALPVIDLN